jgi:NAD(P)-dependent dehydrogenase (short-subunit alcohol dehydrogenase family)
MEDWVTGSIDKNATQYSSLIGKVVFITGGATGIGAAMVRAFVGHKAKVAFIDIDEQASATLITGIEFENNGAQLWYRKVDVTEPRKNLCYSFTRPRSCANNGGWFWWRNCMLVSHR